MALATRSSKGMKTSLSRVNMAGAAPWCSNVSCNFRAIEKLMSLKADSTIKTVNIYYAHSMPSKIEKELIHLTKNKFSDSKVVFEQNKILKGGLVIKAADVVLDYSLSSRLDHLWS